MNAISEAVQRVFGETQQLSVTAFSGAADNRTWYVEHPQVRCLAKLPEHRGGLSIAPALEFEVLQLAGRAGVAPRPLGHDALTQITFVEEVAEAVVLDAQQSSADEWLTPIAEMLRRLHAQSAPAALRPFDPLDFLARYRADARPGAARDAAMLCDEAADLVAQCTHVLAGTSLCHNDLHAGNILVGRQLWLIDFEYAVQAAPLVDIASYAAFNELDAATAVRFAQACLGEELPFTAQQLKATIRIQWILGELWEMARSDNNAA